MNKLLVLISLGCMVFSGCASCKDCQYEMVQSCHACWGWYQVGKPCECSPFPKHYRAGWKAGYKDIAMGGCGLAPPVPPQKYWKARYENCEGRQRIAAWYAGFQCGAIAAEKRCEKTWHPVPNSGMVALPESGCSDCECVTGCPAPACCAPEGVVTSPPVEFFPTPPVVENNIFPLEQPIPLPVEVVQPEESTPEPTKRSQEAKKESQEQLPSIPPVPTAAEPEASLTVPVEQERVVTEPSASSRISMVVIDKLFSKRISRQLPEASGETRVGGRYANYRAAQKVSTPVVTQAKRPAVALEAALAQTPRVEAALQTPAKTPQTVVVKVPVRKERLEASKQVVVKRTVTRKKPTAIANPQKTIRLAAKPRVQLQVSKPTKLVVPTKKVEKRAVQAFSVAAEPAREVLKKALKNYSKQEVTKKPAEAPAKEPASRTILSAVKKPAVKQGGTWKVAAVEAKKPKSTVSLLTICDVREGAKLRENQAIIGGKNKLDTKVVRQALRLQTPVRRNYESGQPSELRVVERRQGKAIILTSEHIGGEQSLLVR